MFNEKRLVEIVESYEQNHPSETTLHVATKDNGKDVIFTCNPFKILRTFKDSLNAWVWFRKYGFDNNIDTYVHREY